MTIVPSHLYYLGGIKAKRIPAVLSATMAKAAKFLINDVVYIHNLQHLVKLSSVDKVYLDDIILRRKNEYEHYTVEKKSGGSRFISAPKEDLKQLQRWINYYILRNLKPHPCCYSYHKNSSIYSCAMVHCSSQWLVKLDVENFFDMTSEGSVYEQFILIGYSPIVSFALARICTYQPTFLTKNHSKWVLYKRKNRELAYSRHNIKYIGRLPQGAPTSPMLSNMVFFELDKIIFKLVQSHGGLYTRYADDLFISFPKKDMNRSDISKIIGRVVDYLRKKGYSLNKTKIKVSPPGAKKIVLGLNVDKHIPHLSKEFKKSIDSHLYALSEFGPVAHARFRGFNSVYGMLEHIKGKIFFAKTISQDYGLKCIQEFYAALEKHGFN